MNHSFNIEITERYGINASVVFQQIYKGFKDGTWRNMGIQEDEKWIRLSIKDIAKIFPYLSKKQVSSAIEKLYVNGLIYVENRNKNSYDRTLWYSIAEDGFKAVRGGL